MRPVIVNRFPRPGLEAHNSYFYMGVSYSVSHTACVPVVLQYCTDNWNIDSLKLCAKHFEIILHPCLAHLLLLYFRQPINDVLKTCNLVRKHVFLGQIRLQTICRHSWCAGQAETKTIFCKVEFDACPKSENFLTLYPPKVCYCYN